MGTIRRGEDRRKRVMGNINKASKKNKRKKVRLMSLLSDERFSNLNLKGLVE